MDYVNLGWRRSYSKLAKKYGCTLRAIYKRARIEGWQDRLEKILLQAKERAPTDADLVDSVVQMNARHIAMLRRAQVKAIEAISEQPMEGGGKAVLALYRAIRGERLGLPSVALSGRGSAARVVPGAASARTPPATTCH